MPPTPRDAAGAYVAVPAAAESDARLQALQCKTSATRHATTQVLPAPNNDSDSRDALVGQMEAIHSMPKYTRTLTDLRNRLEAAVATVETKEKTTVQLIIESHDQILCKIAKYTRNQKPVYKQMLRNLQNGNTAGHQILLDSMDKKGAEEIIADIEKALTVIKRLRLRLTDKKGWKGSLAAICTVGIIALACTAGCVALATFACVGVATTLVGIAAGVGAAFLGSGGATLGLCTAFMLNSRQVDDIEKQLQELHTHMNRLKERMYYLQEGCTAFLLAIQCQDKDMIKSVTIVIECFSQVEKIIFEDVK